MSRPIHRRSGLVAAIALGAALALPATAMATTVSFGANEITTAVTITDSTGVTDGLSVSGSTTTGVTVTSVGRPTGRPITAGTGCTQTTSVKVSCPAAQLLVANLAGGSDSLTDHTNLSATLNGDQGNDRLFAGSGTGTLNGGTGDDVVVGGAGNDIERGGDGADKIGALQATDAATQDPGKDTLEGGSGFDTIHAADGIPDTKIDCGPPPFVEGLILDFVTVDLKDPATTSCDSVSQGAKDQHPLVQVGRRSGRVRGADVAVSFACPKAHPARRCAGTVKVVKSGRTVARGRYRIRRGRKRTLKLPLSGQARGRAQVLTRERDTHGKPETTRTPIRLRGSGVAAAARKSTSLRGSWIVRITGGAGTPALPSWYGSQVTFTSDGGVVATITDPYIHTGHGSWKRVGKSTFRVTILLWQFDSKGDFLGTLKARATLKVHRGSRTFDSNNYRFQFSDPNGKPTGLAGVGKAHGRRIEVAP